VGVPEEERGSGVRVLKEGSVFSRSEATGGIHVGRRMMRKSVFGICV